MRFLRFWFTLALFAALLGLPTGAHAERASCDELLAARAAGRSEAELITAFQTTHARISACERIVAERQRLAGQRADVQDAREARGGVHSDSH